VKSLGASLLALLLAACGKPPARGGGPAEAAPLTAAGRVTVAQGLSFVPGEAWKPRAPASGTRLAEFAIPRAAEDGADGEVALYHFGAGQGGSVEQNLERWFGQFQQPDGSSSKEKAKVDRRKVGDLPVTVAEVSGRYKTAAMAPGQRAYDEQGWRLYAAIVETARGPFFFKAIGPEKTILGARPALETMIDSVRLGG
jgi:hypothetical protein